MYSLILVGIAGLIIHGYLACVAANPACLNISVGGAEATVGEEALGGADVLA